ncbi:MAG: hypothetical protein ACREJ3_11695, partial [Polyangiaceae bacterium]
MMRLPWVSPLRSQDDAPVTVTARAYYASAPLDAGLTFTGTMVRPDGTSIALTFQHSQNSDLGDTATIDPSLYVGRGIYDVTVACQVGATATYAAGESTLAQNQLPFEPAQTFPVRPSAPVPAFSRQTRTAFYLFSSKGGSLPPALAGCTTIASCSGIGGGGGSGGGSGSGPSTGTAAFALYANGLLQIGNDATVQESDGTPAAVVNAGSVLTSYGDAATTGDLWSNAGVLLDEQAEVFGGVTTAVTLTQESGAVVTGSVSEHASLTLPDLHGFAVSFPSNNRGNVLALPGFTNTLAPGSYDNVVITPAATLKLQAGVYYFTSLSIPPLGT